MKNQENFNSLRREAEQALASRRTDLPDTGDDELMRLLHELEVHQVELEMQNEQLQQTARDLETARNEYFDLYDTAPVGFVSINPRGTIERCNATAIEMLGASEDVLTGGLFSSRLFRDDRQTYHNHLRQISRHIKTPPCNVRLVREDGSLIHVHLEVTSKRDPKTREVTSWRYAIVDITDRKRAEDLQASEKRFREAFEHAPVGMALIEPAGGFVHANDALCDMLGYSRSELLGTGVTFAKLTHPDDIGQTTRAYDNLLSGDIPAFCLEKRYIRKDKSVVWTRTNATLKRDETGEPAQIVVMVEDITDWKNAEERLRQAHKMEAIGRLAGGVAHEFNNMLNVIHGNAELIGFQLEPDSPLQKFVSEITGSVKRSADMTDQLLAYCRKQMRTPQVIDINRVIEGQKWMLQRLIGEAVDFAFYPGNPVWPIQIDPSQLDQILVNLVVNAKDAIAGNGTISITTENICLEPHSAEAPPDLPPGEYVRIAVSDTGAGMDESTLNHLFDPYFTTKDIGEGTGLGLATVYGIIKQNDGDITVDSQSGGGTRFHIHFPKSDEQPDRPEDPAEKMVPGHGETVLIVEDEHQVLELAEAILKSAGYTVLKAGTPSAALDMARQHKDRLSIVVADMVLPEMNGKELNESITDLCPEIRTLFMSGYADDAIDGEAIAAAGAAFIQKPFSVDSLTRKVREILDQ